MVGIGVELVQELGLDGLSEVHGLLKEEEHEHGDREADDGAGVLNPAPAVILGDVSGGDGAKKGAVPQGPGVHPHVEASFVGEGQIGDQNLDQGFDGRVENAHEDAVDEPHAATLDVGRPQDHQGSAQER